MYRTVAHCLLVFFTGASGDMTVRLWDIGSAESELDTSMYVYVLGFHKIERQCLYFLT